MIEIHPGDYLRETTIRKVNISAMNEDGEIEYTEVEKEVYNYYLVLDVKDSCIEFYSLNGSVYEWKTVIEMSDICDTFTLIPIKDAKTEAIYKTLYRNGTNSQVPIGELYRWGEKEFYHALDMVYYNGREFLSMPESFYID